MKIENIIFDFGGVLVDWNPRYPYKDYFKEEKEMEHFLKNICTMNGMLNKTGEERFLKAQCCCKINIRNIIL